MLPSCSYLAGRTTTLSTVTGKHGLCWSSRLCVSASEGEEENRIRRGGAGEVERQGRRGGRKEGSPSGVRDSRGGWKELTAS